MDWMLGMLKDDDELLSKGDLDCHASLVVRLRRAEKRILHNVIAYSAAQKTSAAERYEQSVVATITTRSSQTEDGADSLSAEMMDSKESSSSFHISHVSTATGEQEFVRVSDGVQVYGTETERTDSDAKFFESVRRGDYRTVGIGQPDSHNKPANGQSPPAVSLESEVMSDLASLDVNSRTACGESGCPVSSTASAAAAAAADDDDDNGDGATAAGVDINSLWQHRCWVSS